MIALVCVLLRPHFSATNQCSCIPMLNVLHTVVAAECCNKSCLFSGNVNLNTVHLNLSHWKIFPGLIIYMYINFQLFAGIHFM